MKARLRAETINDETKRRDEARCVVSIPRISLTAIHNLLLFAQRKAAVGYAHMRAYGLSRNVGGLAALNTL